MNGSMVRLAGDAAWLRRALAAVTYAPPSSVGMDGVRVIVATARALRVRVGDVHIKAAASSDLTVSHEGDVHGVARGHDGNAASTPVGGAGALNVSVEASRRYF